MEASTVEELRFDYLCGKCFSHSSRSGRPGKVLSCCDFLCYDCGNGIKEPFTCPSCRKPNVKFVSTDDPLIPIEVARNISDPEISMEALKSVLLFQIKHYKTMLHRAVGKMMRDKKEFHRRLSLMEGGGDNGQAGQSISSNEQRTRPPMPTSQTRQLRPEDDSQSERPRKISRPSTGGPSPSSSSSALWRTGSAPRADRQESNTLSGQVNLGAQYRNSAQPVGVQGRLQQRPVTANGRSDNSQSQGMSLSSLLSGGNAVPTMGEKSMGGMSNQYQQGAGGFTGQQQQQQQQQQQRRQQQQDDGQQLRAGNRPSFNIPSQTGNQQGNSFQVTPPTFGAGPGTGSSNTVAVGRPLTPSTLFVQNTQQSQYFPRQQQQTRPGQGMGLGLSGGSGFGGPQGALIKQQQQQQQQQQFSQRPSTTPTPQSRLRSPHGHVPVSTPRPRTPGSMVSGAVGVSISQQVHQM